MGNPGRDAGSGSPGRGRAFPLWFGRGRDPCANPVAVAVAALDLGPIDKAPAAVAGLIEKTAATMGAPTVRPCWRPRSL